MLSNGIDKLQKKTRLAASSGLITWALVAALVYILLIGVGVVGIGFKWISGGAEGAASIFGFANNPLAGVILGILATALVQSSSTVTSVIVGLVAGGVPVSIAVPMIMGANMGTTITNTIVSLGNIGNDSSFRRSFQAATVHDFFNLYCIFIFLPFELIFRPLQQIAGFISTYLAGGSEASLSELNIVGAMTKPIASGIVDFFKFFPEAIGATLSIFLGIVMIMFSVIYLGKLLRAVMVGKAKGVLEKAIGRKPEMGVLSGTVVTVLVQSSSTTTSLIVPLAGAGVLSLRQIFPFTMGANIGTTITALLAAISISGEMQIFALQIALVHFLYNISGVLSFLYIPGLNNLAIGSAAWLGSHAGSNRFWAFGYLFILFFVFPGIVLSFQFL